MQRALILLSVPFASKLRLYASSYLVGQGLLLSPFDLLLALALMRMYSSPLPVLLHSVDSLSLLTHQALLMHLRLDIQVPAAAALALVVVGLALPHSLVEAGHHMPLPQPEVVDDAGSVLLVVLHMACC